MPKDEGSKRGEKKTRRKVRKKRGLDGLQNSREITKVSGTSKLKSKSRRKTNIRKKTLGSLLTETGRTSLPKPNEGTERLFTLRDPLDIHRKSSDRKGEKRIRRKHGHRKELKKLPKDKRPPKEGTMAAGTNGIPERGRGSDVPSNRHRKKPHSLPPLPRTPKSPVSPPESSSEAQSLRRFIGSPPPSALLQKEISGDLQAPDQDATDEVTDDTDAPEKSDNEEFTVYTPSQSLSLSHPRITLNTAPSTPSSTQEELRQENAIVSASTSRRSVASIASLIRSTSALSLNGSLSLPPKLVSYVAEDGSPAVQEYVPDDRSSTPSTRRSSTPSIRDLPSPLRGVSPLEIAPIRPPKAKLKKPKLTPLPKR